MKLVVLAISFTLGLFLGSLIGIGTGVVVPVVMSSVLFSIFSALLKPFTFLKHYVFAVLCITALLAGSLRFHLHQDQLDSETLSRFNGMAQLLLREW